MSAPELRYWWPALLRWWAVLAASLVIVAFAAPKRYTATTNLLVKKDRLPWSSFKTSKLPVWQPKVGEEDLSTIAKALEGGEGASISLWSESAFYFLLDQLAFDAYDFRPFLTARTTIREAVNRAEAADHFEADSLPDDLLAVKVLEDLKIDFDEDTQLLTIEFTSGDPDIAERLVGEFRELLLIEVNAMLDEKDAVTLKRLTERVADLEAELADLDARIAAYQQQEQLIAPTRYLPARYTELLALRERAARQDAAADAADTYVALLIDRADAAVAARSRVDLMDLATGGDPTSGRPEASALVYRDPTLATLREDLATLLLEQERDLLLITEAHPRIIGRAEQIQLVKNAIIDLLVQNNEVEAVSYIIESATAHARAKVFTEAADALEAKLDNYPRWELDLLTLLRQRRISVALLGRMRDLEDMAQSMVAKKESALIRMDDPLASSRASEPNLVIMGSALFFLGTLGAGGWFAFRDRLS